jgi:RNase P subunit RPR2
VRLSDQQRRRAAGIARERGLTCPDCGSSEPVPKDEVRARSGGGADVTMRCEDCESATEMALVLTPEEAKALGLHSLQDLPDAP